MSEKPEFLLTVFNQKAEPILFLKFPTKYLRDIDDAMRWIENVQDLGGHGTIRLIPEANGNKKGQAERKKR